MWPNPQFPADLITFTEEILNEKLHFLYSESKAIYMIIFHFPKFTMIPAKNTQLYHSVAFVIFQLFVKIATVKLWQSLCDSLGQQSLLNMVSKIGNEQVWEINWQ